MIMSNYYCNITLFVTDSIHVLLQCLQVITLVLRDILEALNSLHSQNICHGCVHLQSVFLEKRSGEYRGVLDFYPYTNAVGICLLT